MNWKNGICGNDKCKRKFTKKNIAEKYCCFNCRKIGRFKSVEKYLKKRSKKIKKDDEIKS